MHRTELKPHWHPLAPAVRVVGVAGYEVAIPVVTIDTKAHETRAARMDAYRVQGSNWRTVCRQRIRNLEFLRPHNFAAVY